MEYHDFTELHNKIYLKINLFLKSHALFRVATKRHFIAKQKVHRNYVACGCSLLQPKYRVDEFSSKELFTL